MKSKESESWFIQIGEESVELDFVFVSDMKFMLLATGSPAANGNQTCMLCFACKHNRHQWDRDHGHRSLETYTEGKDGQKRKPAIVLPPRCIVVDELHFILRLGDTMLTRFVKMCLRDLKIKEVAIKNEFSKFKMHFSCTASADTRDEIRVCSYKQDQHLHWLQHLNPSNLILKEGNIADQWKRLFATFLELYRAITDANPSPDRVEGLANGFISSLQLSVINERGETIPLFQPEEVTPYMHVTTHLTGMVAQHGSLKPYSCSSLERKNMLHASQMFSLTKRGNNSCKDLLQMELMCRAVRIILAFKNLITIPDGKPPKLLNQLPLHLIGFVQMIKSPAIKLPSICEHCQSALIEHAALSERATPGWDALLEVENSALEAIESLVVDTVNMLLGSPEPCMDAESLDDYLEILFGDEIDQEPTFLKQVWAIESERATHRYPSFELRAAAYNREKEHKRVVDKQKRQMRAQSKREQKQQDQQPNQKQPTRKRATPSRTRSRRTSNKRRAPVEKPRSILGVTSSKSHVNKRASSPQPQPPPASRKRVKKC
jgi:hypothetical protein